MMTDVSEYGDGAHHISPHHHSHGPFFALCADFQQSPDCSQTALPSLLAMIEEKAHPSQPTHTHHVDFGKSVRSCKLYHESMAVGRPNKKYEIQATTFLLQVTLNNCSKVVRKC